MSINKVIITGNLTRDAVLTTTPRGVRVLNMTVAVNDRRLNKDTGQWEDYGNFVDCTMFGKRAESLSERLVKGTKVAIEGRLHYSTWTDRNDQRRSKLDVTVDELEFFSRRRVDGQTAPAGGDPAQAGGPASVERPSGGAPNGSTPEPPASAPYKTVADAMGEDILRGAYVTEVDGTSGAYTDSDINF